MTKSIAIILCLLLTACVPKSKIRKSYDEGFDQATRDCNAVAKLHLDLISKLQTDLELKNQRLKHFNQVDINGTLYPLKIKVDNSDPKKGS